MPRDVVGSAGSTLGESAYFLPSVLLTAHVHSFSRGSRKGAKLDFSDWTYWAWVAFIDNQNVGSLRLLSMFDKRKTLTS